MQGIDNHQAVEMAREVVYKYLDCDIEYIDVVDTVDEHDGPVDDDDFVGDVFDLAVRYWAHVWQCWRNEVI